VKLFPMDTAAAGLAQWLLCRLTSILRSWV